MATSVRILVPTNSVDPTDWLVYADFAQEYPAAARWSEDKARRIAWVLARWNFHNGVDHTIVNTPKLYLRLVPSHHRVEWPGGIRLPGMFNWQWSITPTPAVPATLSGSFGGGNSFLQPGRDSFTNPAESTLCQGEPRYARKFFNFVLMENVLRIVLTAKTYCEYRETFDHLQAAMTLRDVLRAGHQRVKRVRWVRGEYLEVTNLEDKSGCLTGEARFIAPVDLQDCPFKADSPWRDDHPWPLRLMLLSRLNWSNKNDTDARGGIWNRSKRVRPLARDWVPA